MKKLRNILRRSFFPILVLTILLSSCTAEKKGDIVQDKDGNFYELTHDNSIMGPEMYRLKLIDTTKFNVKGFNKE